VIDITTMGIMTHLVTMRRKCSAAGRKLAGFFGMSARNRLCKLNVRNGESARVPTSCPTRRRLARAFSVLENIVWTRRRYQDPLFGKAAEERIVWRELLELELQSIDEHLDKISAEAGKLGLRSVFIPEREGDDKDRVGSFGLSARLPGSTSDRPRR
jgi:hypothetical protein